MKPITLKRKSWHYWLAVKFGDLPSHRTQTTICEYTSSVIWGLWYGLLCLAVCLVGTLGACALTYAIAKTGMWVYAGLHTGWTAPDDFAKIGLVFVVSFLTAGAALGAALGAAITRHSRRNRKPSFSALALRSAVDKVCFRIDLE